MIIQGFDTIAAYYLTSGYNNQGIITTGSPTIDSSYRFNSTYNGSLKMSGVNQYISKSQIVTACTLSFSFMHAGYPTSSQQLAAFTVASNANVALTIAPNLCLSFGTLTNPIRIRAGLWYHVEVYIYVLNTNITISLTVNGNTVSSVNSCTNSLGVTSWMLGTDANGNSNNAFYYDDFVTFGINEYGSTTVLGDYKVEALAFTAISSTQWVVVGGTAPGVLTEVPANGNTLVGSTTVGQADMFTTADLPAAATVVAMVQFDYFSAATDNTVQIKPQSAYGGSTYAATTYTVTGAGTWLQYSTCTTTYGGNSWTPAVVNGSTFGYMLAN